MPAFPEEFIARASEFYDYDDVLQAARESFSEQFRVALHEVDAQWDDEDEFFIRLTVRY